MIIDEIVKKKIDSMSYEQMLQKWRHTKSGDLMFQGDVGDYYSKSMAKKECALDPGEKVRISKQIGW